MPLHSTPNNTIQFTGKYWICIIGAVTDHGIVSKVLYLPINNNEGVIESGSMWKHRLLFGLIILFSHAS